MVDGRNGRRARGWSRLTLLLRTADPETLQDGRWSLAVEGIRATRAAGACASRGDAASRPARRSLLLPGFRRQTRPPVPKPSVAAKPSPADSCRAPPRSPAATECRAGASASGSWNAVRHTLASGMGVKAAMPLLHHRGYAVVGRLNVAGYGKRVERVHGPGAVEQVPIFITGQVAEPGHRLDLKRRRVDKARRLAAGKIVLETHNGLFVALALGVRVGPMPKNVSKHGANHRRCASPSTRRAIDRCRDGSKTPRPFSATGRQEGSFGPALRSLLGSGASSLLHPPGGPFNRAPSGITIWP